MILVPGRDVWGWCKTKFLANFGVLLNFPCLGVAFLVFYLGLWFGTDF